MHNKISDTLDNNNNFWKELRKLGLIPSTNDALHGFLPDELNTHFSNLSISPSEDPAESAKLILTASSDGFIFHPVSANDVVLAFSHFTSQAQGDDGTEL